MIVKIVNTFVRLIGFVSLDENIAVLLSSLL